MRRIEWILVICLLFGIGFANAQTTRKIKRAQFSDLPTLSQEFIEKYLPKLTISTISVEGNREADVKFTDGTKVEFGRDGYFKEIENDRGLTTEHLQMLPESMRSSLQRDYSTYRIESVKHGDLFYKVELEGNNGKDIEIHYDLNGQYLY